MYPSFFCCRRNRLNRISILFFFVFSVGCTETITPVFPISYSFDEDAQGWQGSVGCKSGYSPTGGNSGGYVYGIDETSGVWFFVASHHFVDISKRAYGLTLSFDLVQSATDAQANTNDDVILTDGTTQLTFNTPYNPSTRWTNYFVKLDEKSGWKKGRVNATKTDVQQVLQNLTSIRIRGEFRSGPDRGGLDNVSIQ